MKWKSLEWNEIEGKTIKKIGDYYDGLLIEFTDGLVVELSQSTFPDGSYNTTTIAEVDKESKYVKEGLYGEVEENPQK